MIARTALIHSSFVTETASVPYSAVSQIQMTPNITYYGFYPKVMAKRALTAFADIQSNHDIVFPEEVCPNCTINALVSNNYNFHLLYQPYILLSL